jgi:hypothetical protein
MRCLLFLAVIQLAALSIEKRETKRLAYTCMAISAMCIVCVMCRSDAFASMYTGIGGAQKYLLDKGLRLVDLGSAMIMYEMIGLVIMLIVWWVCFLVQPVQNGLLQPIFSLIRGTGTGQGSGNSVMEKADNFYKELMAFSKKKFEGIAKRMGVDPVRLTMSYAEGSLFRSLMKPVLVPLKLYGAYAIITSDSFKSGLDYVMNLCST